MRRQTNSQRYYGRGEGMMEFSEIAAKLGKKLSTVKMTYFDGIRRIRRECPRQLQAIRELLEEKERLEQQRLPRD
jgi:DNA-directed RNA polymerase specialized sigma24 family protein